MSKYSVVLTDNIFPDTEIERHMLSEIDAELIVVPKGACVEEYIKDADAVINTYYKMTSELIDNMERCKLIIRNGIGVDTIDVEACTKRGIMVANVPHYCSDEAATHTMALILATVRKLKPLDASVSRGIWDVKSATPLFSLPGKQLGLIGFGKIPRLVTEKARAFGLHVCAYDPFVSTADMNACLVEMMEFDELIQNSDIISIHCPLNKQTRNLFNIQLFRKMKETAFLVNTARGPIVNENDLLFALENSLIAGAGLDVLEKDEVQLDNPLLHMEQVIITPHAAWYSEESIIRRRTLTIESVVSVLQGGEPVFFYNRQGLQSGSNR